MKVAVYAGTRNLYETMNTALRSLLANTEMDRVYLLTEDDSFPFPLPDNVTVINVSNQPYFPEDGANYHNRWTYMSMIRLALTMIIPEENKVLWLDCDTIVDADISELFDTDLEGCFVAGVKEHNKKGWKDYINAGVMLMNLGRIRAYGMDHKLIEYINREKLECPDQDAVNILCAGEIKFLPSRYNVCPFTEPPDEMKIFHYAARQIFDNDPLYRKYSGKNIPTRTLIAIPCFDMVHTDFMKAFVGLERDDNTSYTIIKNTLIYNARNMVAENAIRYGFDRVLWLDSDVVFPKDTLKRLSEDMDNGRDFVSGLYFMRTENTKPVLFSEVGYEVKDNEASVKSVHYLDYPKDTLFECAATGFGCVMTSANLLKKLTEKYGAPFTPMMGLSEDVAFCWRARQNGFKLYCDSRVKCGHIGQAVITEKSYLHPLEMTI